MDVTIKSTNDSAAVELVIPPSDTAGATSCTGNVYPITPGVATKPQYLSSRVDNGFAASIITTGQRRARSGHWVGEYFVAVGEGDLEQGDWQMLLCPLIQRVRKARGELKKGEIPDDVGLSPDGTLLLFFSCSELMRAPYSDKDGGIWQDLWFVDWNTYTDSVDEKYARKRLIRAGNELKTKIFAYLGETWEERQKRELGISENLLEEDGVEFMNIIDGLKITKKGLAIKMNKRYLRLAKFKPITLPTKVLSFARTNPSAFRIYFKLLYQAKMCATNGRPTRIRVATLLPCTDLAIDEDLEEERLQEKFKDVPPGGRVDGKTLEEELAKLNIRRRQNKLRIRTPFGNYLRFLEEKNLIAWHYVDKNKDFEDRLIEFEILDKPCLRTPQESPPLLIND